MQQKPEYRAVLAENIPDELKAHPYWCVWKSEWNGEKWTKPPYHPETGRKLSGPRDDLSQYTSFETALEAYQNGNYTGIGLWPEGLVVGDLDKCVDSENTIVNEEAEAILSAARTYAELSPTISGEGETIGGLRFVFFGKKPGKKCRDNKRGFEIYDGSSYLTITGHTLNGDKISDDADKIAVVYGMMFPSTAPKSSSVSAPNLSPSSVQFSPPGFRQFKDMTDIEKLEWCLEKYPDFPPLWNGDISGHDSHSEADFALMRKLVQLFGRDESRVADFFRQSGLWTEERHKGKGKDYVEKSAVKAVSGFTGQTTEEYFDSRPEPDHREPEPVKIPEGFEAELLKQVADKPGYAFNTDILKIAAELDPEQFQDLYFKLSLIKGFPKGDFKKAVAKAKRQNKKPVKSESYPAEVSPDAFPYGEDGKEMFMLKRYMQDGNEFFSRERLVRGGVIRILSEEIVDNGEAETEIYNISATTASGRDLPVKSVKQEDLPKAQWLFLWPKYIHPEAGYKLRDHSRLAVQCISGIYPTIRAYGFTGWKKINGKYLYLCNSGAIGADGFHSDITVKLDGNMTAYDMPTLGTKEGVRQSLELSALMPYSLLSAAYRSPLCEFFKNDVSVFISGSTGIFKSELTALVQAHFGSEFNGRYLPDCWNSTANSIGKRGFMAKDAVFTIDEFKPSGSQTQVRLLHKKADDVLRDAANGSGRGRMNPDGSLKKTFYCRGVIVSSGEDLPKGQSLQARLISIQLKPGSVDKAELSKAQEKSKGGVYAGAMALYIQWIADKAGKDFEQALHARFIEIRDSLYDRMDAAHDRTPSNFSQMLLGLDTFLTFAVDKGYISQEERNHHFSNAILEAVTLGNAQTSDQSSENEVDIFLESISSLVSSGYGHLCNLQNGQPKNPLSWGWENDGIKFYAPRGIQIGWTDGSDVWLNPSAAFKAVQDFNRSQGKELAVSSGTLWKRMREQGKLLSFGKEPTKQKKILGKNTRTLHLSCEIFGFEAEVTENLCYQVENCYPENETKSDISVKSNKVTEKKQRTPILIGSVPSSPSEVQNPDKENECCNNPDCFDCEHFEVHTHKCMEGRNVGGKGFVPFRHKKAA